MQWRVLVEGPTKPEIAAERIEEPFEAWSLQSKLPMRQLKICRASDEWYVTLHGTFVVGFIGANAEQHAREQLSQLEMLLDLHSAVSTESETQVQVGSDPSADRQFRDDT